VRFSLVVPASLIEAWKRKEYDAPSLKYEHNGSPAVAAAGLLCAGYT